MAATKAELQKALDDANASRSEDEQIKPEGSNKADLEAALTAAGVDLPEGEAAPVRKLALYVSVDGVQYGPDDDVPAEVAKQIDNPDVWAEEPKASSSK